MTRLESLFPLGRLDEALTQVKALLEDREGAGAWESGSQVWMGLRSWELYLNHLLGLPQQDITPVLTAVRANDDPQIRGPSLTWCMMAAWDRGEHDLAQTIADELSAAYEGDPQVQALVFPTAGDVLIEMGRTDLLEEMNITLGSVWRYQEANHRRTKGVLAEADGDLDTAVEALRASMAIFDLLGHKFGPVWAGIPLARVLLAQGKDAEANALLDMIEPQAVEMNAGLFLDQIASIRGTSATPSATSEAG